MTARRAINMLRDSVKFNGDTDLEKKVRDEHNTLIDPATLPEALADDVLDNEKFPARLHAHKTVAEMRASFGVTEGLIFLPGQPSSTYEDSDQGPTFRQRRYFFYLSGVDWANCFATYDIGRDYLILWIPYCDPKQAMWFGRLPSKDTTLKRHQINEVRYNDELSEFLAGTLGKDVKTLYVLRSSQIPQFTKPVDMTIKEFPAPGDKVPSEDGDDMFFPKETAEERTDMDYVDTDTAMSVDIEPSFDFPFKIRKSSSGNPKDKPRQKNDSCLVVNHATSGHFTVNTYVLKPAIDEARVIKTPYEIAMIRKACAISSLGHLRVIEQLLHLRTERDIEAVFQATCTAAGARTQAYPIIAGAGKNSACLHYEENNCSMIGKEIVLLDAGCEFNCYASDLTRTLPICGAFTPPSRQIYDMVSRIQETCIAAAQPGVYFYALHMHACRMALRELMRAKFLLNGTAEEIWEAGTVGAFFPHGLGHHLGLEVHDVSGRQKLLLGLLDDTEKHPSGRRVKRPMVHPTALAEAVSPKNGPPREKGRQRLRPGMVVTVEPGLYFSKDYIEGYFANDPRHRKFLNLTLLDQFYSVGGCRLEDDILITENGNEVLTLAPKGNEMLDIINRRPNLGILSRASRSSPSPSPQ